MSCAYCESDNAALRRTYYNMQCEGCLLRMGEPHCVACGGNDRDAPCAYPGEGKPGCLRDARLK